MTDLKSPHLIIAKGVLFLLLALFAAGLILAETRSLRLTLLLGIAIWASCRFYYFLFYVLEKYVDSRLRYAGLMSLLLAAWRRR